MVIPTLQQAGVYYLWPGLQPTDNSGVYQKRARRPLRHVVVRVRVVLLEPEPALGRRVQHVWRGDGFLREYA